MTTTRSSMMMKPVFAALGCLIASLIGGSAFAAGGEVREYRHAHWSWDGPMGHYEQAQLQRGFQVFQTVCAQCHSMEFVAFRHLGEQSAPYHLDECPAAANLGESVDCSDPAQNPIVKSLAASYIVLDGPNEEGDMFERPGAPTDYIGYIMSNNPAMNQQMMTNAQGAYPPDLSLITKARHHGPDYVYSLLTGYETPPDFVELPAGSHYNPYYPGDMTSLIREEFLDDEGHVIGDAYVPEGGVLKMAQPLRDGMISYTDGSPETVDQYSQDVVAFLMWAAEPGLTERKSLGRFVIFYLIIFAGIVYVSYRQIWRKVH